METVGEAVPAEWDDYVMEMQTGWREHFKQFVTS